MPKNILTLNIEKFIQIEDDQLRHQKINDAINEVKTNQHVKDHFENMIQEIANLQYLDAKLMINNLQTNIVDLIMVCQTAYYMNIGRGSNKKTITLNEQRIKHKYKTFENTIPYSLKTQFNKLFNPHFKTDLQTTLNLVYSFNSVLEHGEYTIHQLNHIDIKAIHQAKLNHPERTSNIGDLHDFWNLLTASIHFSEQFNPLLDQWYRDLLQPENNHNYQTMLRFRRRYSNPKAVL